MNVFLTEEDVLKTMSGLKLQPVISTNKTVSGTAKEMFRGGCTRKWKSRAFNSPPPSLVSSQKDKNTSCTVRGDFNFFLAKVGLLD